MINLLILCIITVFTINAAPIDKTNKRSHLINENGIIKLYSNQNTLHKKATIFYKPTLITCDNTNRYTYTYDDAGNEIIKIHEEYINNNWVNYSITTSEYNNGNMINCLFQLWENNMYVNSYQYSYTYDDLGNCISRLYEEWIDNMWKLTARTTNTFDNHNRRIIELYELYNGTAWVNSERYSSTFDNSGNLVSYLSEEWVNNTWKNKWREVFSYDSSNKMISASFENWTNNQWTYDMRWTFTYDNSGNQETNLIEKWINNTWINSSRTTFSYNNSALINALYELWENNQWVNSQKIEYTYDANGNQTEILRQSWTVNTWENNKKLTYTFDNFNNCIHAENFKWQSNSWVHEIEFIELYYNNRQEYIYLMGSVIDLQYSPFTSLPDEVKNVNTFNLQQNYPNPFNPSTTISYSLLQSADVKLTITDVLGNEIETLVNEYKPAGDYLVHFNGSKLVSGIYFYKLQSGGNSSVKKLVLLK